MSGGPVATFFVSGGVLSVFYILTRDLAACMMAHAITDIVGFVAARNATRGRGQREQASRKADSDGTGEG